MAIIKATGNGNWSSTTPNAPWNGGTKPATGDTVHANNFTITVDENTPALNSVRTTSGTGISAGGSFVLNAGITLTGNVISGSSTCVTKPNTGSATSTIIGNITAGSAVGALNNKSGAGAAGTLAIQGNVSGGPDMGAIGVHNASTGSITITGSVVAGDGYMAPGVYNALQGTVTVGVNVTGGGNSAEESHGIYDELGGTVSVSGNVVGGTGFNCQGIKCDSGGTFVVTGNATGGNGNFSHGINCAGSGATLTVNGTAIGNNAGIDRWSIGVEPADGMAYGVSTGAGNNVKIGRLQYGLYGMSPVSGVITILGTTAITSGIRLSTTGALNTLRVNLPNSSTIGV